MRIAIIGAGNVATHLAKAFHDQAEICQIVARTEVSAKRLAVKINAGFGDTVRGRCEAVTDLRLLRGDMELYVIAVNDDSVAQVVDSTSDFPGVWVHTSGSVGMDVFKGKKQNYGVFYPLQTFSRDVPVDFGNIPILIEGSSPGVTEYLVEIARGISGTVRLADSRTRESIHVAAVFACNFTNLMWEEADRLLRQQGMDIRFMLPLLQATLDKLALKTPREAMTGPARRGDMAVINKHLASLPDDLKPVYSLLTENIMRLYAAKE